MFNERRSSNSRNFLGKARVPGSSVGREGEEVAQLFGLDKRSLFSHVRGELSLKVYLSSREDVGEVKEVSNLVFSARKSKKGVSNQQQQQHHLGMECKMGNHNQNLTLNQQILMKQGEQNPGIVVIF